MATAPHLDDGVLHRLEEERRQGVILPGAQGVQILLPAVQVRVGQEFVPQSGLAGRQQAQGRR